MTGHDLRTRFLEFFRAQGHPVVDSDFLVPAGDPTVLFTSAGMNQFKDYFLGKRTDLKRAASCQKCLRTGDLERVGKSASHHSFFEMLGNFSFGDYFKPEAISWAWEFLTGTTDFKGTPSSNKKLCLAIPAQNLWVSVYQDDQEAKELWLKLGVPGSKIVSFGAKDNFWPSNAPTDGPNGPCGPCSEIYYDPDGLTNGPNSVEVWNLVFTQFDRQSDGSLKPLPKPNIDTGMGLERLTRVIQGVPTDYETDLFQPILKAVRKLPKGEMVKADRVLFVERAIADHARAIVFLLADGVMPSNESRGYVLRMLIRRVYRLAVVVLDVPYQKLSLPVDLSAAVEEAMRNSPYFDELVRKRSLIREAWNKECVQFGATLEVGTIRTEELIKKLEEAGETSIPGDEAFKLYDTWGFPLELTTDIAEERGFAVDRAGFDKAMQEQQERSRAGSQFGGGVFVPATLKLDDGTRSEFTGYEALAGEAKIKGIWKRDQWAPSAQAGDEVILILDRSPFYGESGGQVGDHGAVEGVKGAADVLNTTWVGELLAHSANVSQGTLKVGEPVKARVDAQRRLRVARSHTATHLLHWALRKVLGAETAQAGSLVEVDRLRFDFSARGGLPEEQRLQVERLVNERVRLSDPVHTDVMKLEDAKRTGAMALFGEKYAHDVRVVSIGDYSKELCGGTHLLHTGFVGLFRIVEESSIAAGTRRLDAVVGDSAAARQQDDTQQLAHIARQLNRPPQDALQGVEDVLRQVKELQKQLQALKLGAAGSQAAQLIAEGKPVDGTTFIGAQLSADRELLSALADAIKGRLKTGAVVLVSAEGPANVMWVMAVTADLVKRGVHAGRVLKEVSALTQGSGGGRPDFAQAGGKDVSKVTDALHRAEQLVREALQT